MKLIWHGTAAIEAACSGGILLFDPFVPWKGSTVDVHIEEFDDFPDIFITHGHFDHISSLPAIVQRNPDVRIHCTETPYRTLLKKGIPPRNLILIRFGDTIRINCFTVHVHHGRHAVLPWTDFKRVLTTLKSPLRRNLPGMLREHRSCRENEETVFCHLEADGKTVSIMGSLNLRSDTSYPQHADLLVLPYNGWQDNLPPAIEVIERLQPDRIVLDHYDDSFPPMTQPLDLTPVLQKYSGRIEAMALRKEILV